MTEAASAPVPVHRRVIEFNAYDEGESIRVVGRLQDERPWGTADSADPVRRDVHDMTLEVDVRKHDRVVTSAHAAMGRFPHAECPDITRAYESLVGLQVGRGFGHAVRERFGGPAGCTHLGTLAQALATVVIQALTSERARSADPNRNVSEFTPGGCHVWAEDGPAPQKVALGWRPGKSEYPVPPVSVLAQRFE